MTETHIRTSRTPNATVYWASIPGDDPALLDDFWEHVRDYADRIGAHLVELVSDNVNSLWDTGLTRRPNGQLLGRLNQGAHVFLHLRHSVARARDLHDLARQMHWRGVEMHVFIPGDAVGFVNLTSPGDRATIAWHAIELAETLRRPRAKKNRRLWGDWRHDWRHGGTRQPLTDSLAAALARVAATEANSTNDRAEHCTGVIDGDERNADQQHDIIS